MKVIIKDRITDLTPSLMASVFSEMNSESQAEFFNSLGVRISEWKNGRGSWAMQLQYISEETCLTRSGRNAMEAIGEYAK